MNKLVFSIETSCDETSVAIIDNNRNILSHITINQGDHSKFGGVVPEIASRSHLQILQRIIPESLKQAGIKISNIDLFSATCGPGLIGGLLIGSTIAKAIALGLNKPFFPINHLEGHLLSTMFSEKIMFPHIALLLTGGHTQIYLVKSIGKYTLLGETVDDAIGESFDKVAKLIGHNYPGGAKIEKLALQGNSEKYKLPHPLQYKKDLNFSFSGIKTAVSLIVKNEKKLNNENKKDIAASFQSMIVKILEVRTKSAFEFLINKNHKIKYLSVVGGVAANKKIKETLSKIASKYGCQLVSPPLNLCGDNAAMIANVCLEHHKLDLKPNLYFNPNPRLSLY